MQYIYYNKSNKPDLESLESDISNSSMTNKTVAWSRWDEDPSEITIEFTVALNSSDKAILDNILTGY